MHRHILIIDNDALLRRSLAFNLEKAGYRVSAAATAEDALAQVRLGPPDLVLLDIGQVLTMPLFFASNAIYPISMMPGWLQAISHANPLTYEVDALRALMLASGTSAYGVGLDVGILLAATAALIMLGGKLHPNVVI